jgi:putative Holliday junction resolvase
VSQCGDASQKRGKKVLGVDYGSVRIGLAVSDPEHKIAFPLATYERRDSQQDAEFLLRTVAAEGVERIVVGLPIHLDGHEGTKAAEVRRFGKWLEEVTSLSVVYFDERFTTAQAEQLLWDAGLSHKGRKARRDRVAAQIILQAYLDAGCPEGERGV